MRWSEDEDAFLRREFPDHPTAMVAEVLGRSVPSVAKRASALGVHKSAEWRSIANSGRRLDSERAAHFGRLGGLVGGVRRAESLTPKQRSAIAAKGGSAPRRIA